MQVPSLTMSTLIASDAPLLSPTSDAWDHSQLPPAPLDAYTVSYSNYALASPAGVHSPMPTARMLKSSSRTSPDGSESEQSLCIPTHQVFDYSPSPPALSDVESQQSPYPAADMQTTSNLVPSKRAASVAPSSSKKSRITAVSTKDFIPPDVSGLSKREARLVKNRAAAFLSRQRKREEFETMEIRVAELEEENQRLAAMASNRQPDDTPEDLVSEVEQLRRQLAAAQERERALSAQLSQKAVARPQPVKMETFEPEMPSRAASVQPQKSGASLGLMVLLCALPSLLSVHTHSTLPATFSFPISGSSSLPPASTAFDVNSFMPGDYDWGFSTESSIMDLDVDDHGRVSNGFSMAPSAKKLEFVDVDSEALGLGGLDISFDAMASEDGKIRVRIHPPPATASTSVTAAPSPSSSGSSESDEQSVWGGSEFSGPSSSTPDSLMSSSVGTPNTDSDDLGPFLGMGALDKGDMDFMSHLSGSSSADTSSDGMSSSPMGSLAYPSSDSAFDFASGFGADSFSTSSASAGRRRVRIALKSFPGQGHEGGEWEVQVC
ncbi:hypothetical protein EUX98_g8987 [Antrodiella citrinella]|uniref:BZIP domain-containing protein n=1 Tax=Antrodiella citrinella TaxID=2447956 RepID=A0A4V3XFQ4_9APHY|nr:hypothetical protein EUX98_g8987 [Antrodiella citrinella]